jgi:transposase
MVSSSRERGEAVHARRYPYRSVTIGATCANAPQATSQIQEGFGPNNLVALVGFGDADPKSPRGVVDLSTHAAQLETALAQREGLRPGRQAAHGETAGGVAQVHQSHGPNGAGGSAIVGIRLHPVDSASSGGILGPDNRGSSDGQLGFGASSNPRIRLAQDQADHSESAGSQGEGKGPEAAPEAKKGVQRQGADYELWFTDGVRFDLLPVTTYTYRKRGEPLRIPTPGTNRRIAVQGAYRWPDGPFRFSYGARSVNTNHFLGMLAQLEERANRTGKRIILVLDNGSAHTSRRSQEALARVKHLIRPFWLPPYTSEQLNDIEAVWKHLKDDYFSRMLTRKADHFVDEAVKLLSRMRTGKGLRQMLKPHHHDSVRKKLVSSA